MALWLLIYLVFFPAAYLGWIGMFGETAKKAADQYFHLIGLALVGLGILMAIDIAIQLLSGIFAAITGG